MPLLKIPGCSLYPVKAIINMINLVPTKPNMALFAKTNGKPITYPLHMKFLKGKIKEIVLNKNKFSTHSFHRGAVSWAIKNGIPESMVQVMVIANLIVIKCTLTATWMLEHILLRNSVITCEFF